MHWWRTCFMLQLSVENRKDFVWFLYRWWRRAVWGTLCVCWRFSPGTGEREPSSPSPGPWHTKRTPPCIPEADGGGTGPGGASGKNTVAPGSTHPTENEEEEEEETDGEMVQRNTGRESRGSVGEEVTPDGGASFQKNQKSKRKENAKPENEHVVRMKRDLWQFLRWWREHTADIAPVWWFRDSRAPGRASAGRMPPLAAALTCLVCWGMMGQRQRRQKYTVRLTLYPNQCCLINRYSWWFTPSCPVRLNLHRCVG